MVWGILNFIYFSQDSYILFLFTHVLHYRKINVNRNNSPINKLKNIIKMKLELLSFQVVCYNEMSY